jgi:biotin carboxyl carrier protein
VKEGDSVDMGATLLVLEAMKMESEITAPKAGTVTKILVEKGTIVESGQDLVIIE